MNLPPSFSLKVACPQAGDLAGLIFLMRVTAGTKNHYHIMFPKTTADGTAHLTAQDFRSQFKDHGDTFMMDYNGSIETASDVVAFELYDQRFMEEGQKQISHWPLSKYERTLWKSRQEFIEYLLSARNREFDFDTQSMPIARDGVINLTVTRRSGAKKNVA